MVYFKDEVTFDERAREAARVKTRYPDRCPIIVEPRTVAVPTIDRRKYIVPSDMTAAQFIYIIRKRLRFQSTEALFLFAGDSGTIIAGDMKIMSFVTRHANDDGFLYIKYDLENTFG